MSRFQLSQNMLPPVQSIDIINPTSQMLTENQEGNTLIWYDASLSLTNLDIINTKQALRTVNDYVLLFDNEEKCVHYVKSISSDNIFMVISGTSSTTLLPQIHELKQVKIMCIFCMNGEAYKSLLNDYSKVISVCIEQEQLIICLKKSIHFFLRNQALINLMKNETKQKTHLNAEDAYNFKKQRLIKDIVLRMPRTQQSKQQLIDYCNFYYQGNKKALEDIDEFNEHYDSPNHAIHWYTRDSLWYRTINHAFRIQDPELLERFHFYIVDLSESLKHRFELLKTSLLLSEPKVLKLYRAQQFSQEEYRRFPSHGFVSFNSYLSTSSNVEVAKIYGKPIKNPTLPGTDSVSVLFIIEVDVTSLNNNTVILANISETSNFPEECEYLFDFGATFEIIDIDAYNHTINMIVSDKPHHVCSTQLYDGYIYKYGSEELRDETRYYQHNLIPDNFAESLLQIDKSLLKLDAFEAYILKTSIIDENYRTASKYCIDGFLLPRTDPNSFYARECRKINPDNPYIDEYTDAYKTAVKYFQAFYDDASDDFIQWSLRALGYTHYKIGNYEQAQTYFIKALQMNNDALSLATCHYFLGCIHGELSDYVKAMNYFNKILQMKDSIELSFIAATYCQITMFDNQNNEKECLLPKTMKKEYLSYALDIYQGKNEELFTLKCRSELLNLEGWPSYEDCIGILDHYYKYYRDHQIELKPIIEVYESIGKEYFKHFDYDRALECYMKAILYSPNNEFYYEIISDIYIKKKDSKSAIKYLEKFLELTKDSRKVVDCHLLLGLEYFKQNNFSMALRYSEQSALLCVESDCDIQFSDYIFGFKLRRKSQIATCISMVKRCSKARKVLYICTEALTFSLDFIKLFQSEIILLFEIIDLILKSNSAERIRPMIEENSNSNETDLKKCVLETIFDNYVIMGDTHDGNHLFYFAKALEIYHEEKKVAINRDIDSLCTSKINHILTSNHSYKVLTDHNKELLSRTGSQIEVQEEDFKRNYFIELKRNQLAKIYSHMGDVYSKTEMYEKAKLSYDKSIEYYETFPSLFHLEIADLCSKKSYIIHAQHEQQGVINDNYTFRATAQDLLEKSIATIKHERTVEKTGW